MFSVVRVQSILPAMIFVALLSGCKPQTTTQVASGGQGFSEATGIVSTNVVLALDAAKSGGQSGCPTTTWPDAVSPSRQATVTIDSCPSGAGFLGSGTSSDPNVFLSTRTNGGTSLVHATYDGSSTTRRAFEIWANFTADDGTTVVLMSTTGDAFQIQRLDTGSLALQIPGTQQIFGNLGNGFHQIVVSFTAGVASVYVDAVLQGTASIALGALTDIYLASDASSTTATRSLSSFAMVRAYGQDLPSDVVLNLCQGLAGRFPSVTCGQ